MGHVAGFDVLPGLTLQDSAFPPEQLHNQCIFLCIPAVDHGERHSMTGSFWDCGSHPIDAVADRIGCGEGCAGEFPSISGHASDVELKRDVIPTEGNIVRNTHDIFSLDSVKELGRHGSAVSPQPQARLCWPSKQRLKLI